MDLVDWLRRLCSEYKHEPYAIFRRQDTRSWPLVAASGNDLLAELHGRGNFLALPKEPAALANIIEVALIAFVEERIRSLAGAQARPGSERGYPDIELSGPAFGGGFHAVDIKVARRARNLHQTQSAITLMTGNTYFRWPELPWSGIMRPFAEYATHLDMIAIYTLDDTTTSRVRDLELIVQEPWRIASRQRSSTTR